MGPIKIQVGAAMNADVNQLFRPFVDSARKARETIQAELGGGISKGARSGADDAARSMAKLSRDAEREADKVGKAFERAMTRFGSAAMSNFRSVLNVGARVGGGILRGAGVNLDISSNVQNAVQAQSGVAMLSRKGYQEGAAGAAGVKQAPAELMKDVNRAADATAHSINATVDAMTKFTESSGDLEMARKMIESIGKVSNATGADIGTMAVVAGRLDLKLQDTVKSTEERKKIIEDTMRVFAAQGKTGAIDIEQLAPQIPRMIAASGRLAGGQTEAFQTAGIGAQIAAAGGGKATPAQAAGAVASLLETMTKSQSGFLGPKKGPGAGSPHIGVFADEGRTKLRNPLEVMAELVTSTKGNISKMAALVPNVRANAIGMGMQSIYTGAGGGKAGEQAIRDAIDKYKKAVMSQAEVDQENADRLKESAAKVQVFQNNLERIAGTVAERVIPAFEKFEGPILSITEKFGGLVAWLAENPGKAIVMAIVGSIVKAGIGTALSEAVKTMMGSSGVGASGGAMAAGLGLTIAMAAITITTATILAGEAKGADTEKKGIEDTSAFIDRISKKINKGEDLTPEEAANAKAFEQGAKERLAAGAGRYTGDSVAGNIGQGAKDVYNLATGSKTTEGIGAEKADAAHALELISNIKALHLVMSGIQKGTIKVHVVNQPPTTPGATSGPPAPGAT